MKTTRHAKRARKVRFDLPPQPVHQRDEHVIIKRNTRPILVFTLISLVVIVLLVYGFKQWIGEHNHGVNVGGGSRIERIVRPMKKPLQCTEDKDCPAETKCTPEGICAPVLIRLPVTVAQPGSGRADEKNTK